MNEQTIIPIVNDDHIRCALCDVVLIPMDVRARYLKSEFPTKALACPVCGHIYISEALVFGKINEVERTLEEK